MIILKCILGINDTIWIMNIFSGFGDEGRSFSFAFKTFVDDLDSQFSMFFTSSTPFEFSAFYGNKEDPFAQFFTSKYNFLMILTEHFGKLPVCIHDFLFS